MKIKVFADFDGTISRIDTLQTILRLYADEKWIQLEDDWLAGRLPTIDCLDGQVQLLPDNWAQLTDFANSITIDEMFLPFNNMLIKNRVELLVISDGINELIRLILTNNGVGDLPVISNRVDNSVYPYRMRFPYYRKEHGGCAVCKGAVIADYRNRGYYTVHIGDGRSDFCAADNADFIFAKGALLEYCQRTGYKHLPFDNFGDIHRSFLREVLNNAPVDKEDAGGCGGSAARQCGTASRASSSGDVPLDTLI